MVRNYLKAFLLAGGMMIASGSAAAQVADAPPAPPAGAAASFVTPARDATGYKTLNRDLGDKEAVWHLRVALNVAALGCRGPAAEAMVAAYNAMLTTHQEALADAQSGTEEAYRKRAGAAWQARYDDEMTKLYNYFATPPVHDAFCATAADLLRAANAVEPANFATFATNALPRLEAAFTTFFAAFDSYKLRLADWQARNQPRTLMIATVSTPQVGPAVLTHRGPIEP